MYRLNSGGLGATVQSGNGSIDITLVSGITAAPEIDPGSTASALTLLLGGVVALRARRKRTA